MLKGRVALVTGASRGIGAATAWELAGNGASVGVNYLNSKEKAEALVERIRAAGGRAVAVAADTREADQVTAMARRVSEELGPVDTLVINASIRFPVMPFLEFKWEDFEAKLTGELKSAFNCAKAFVPGMLDRKKGCIIAVSSTLSRHAGAGFCAHSTAKSGLDAFMKSLAGELGPHGIRVNVIAPGLTITDATASTPPETRDAIARMTPLGRVAQPKDIAGAIALMASDQAGFLTGAYLPVSGGALML